jgi:hypothetical protein
LGKRPAVCEELEVDVALAWRFMLVACSSKWCTRKRVHWSSATGCRTLQGQKGDIVLLFPPLSSEAP